MTIESTTEQQDQSFSEAMSEFVDLSVDDASFVLGWIADNLEPQDIFEFGKLAGWAKSAADDLKIMPGGIFHNAALARWAADNGFVKEEESQ